MTKEELYSLISSDEDYRIERTVSVSDMDKFQEAICAFANDMPGSRRKGYLLIGVKDDSTLSGLQVTDALMKRISSIRSDGNILPLPVMTTEKVVTDEGDVLVVEVTPSFDTPVRYRGRTFIRIGPRRDIATKEEERILSERCAASLPTFDTCPCREATLDDLYTDVIVSEYLPKAIETEVLKNDHRSLKEQLASLRLYNMQYDCPTYAALVMFGRNPKYFMPGAYLQFVRFSGENNAGTILNERRFEGCLYRMLPELENFIRDGIITQRPIPVSILREKNVHNYPYKALRELLMNAVMHRDYQANMPIRLYQYDTHIEIMNPGGLYGQARPENFPFVNDYRNSVVAEMMRTLNYVNMFNHGVGEVLQLLKENGSPEATFNVRLLTAFSVIVKEPKAESLSPTVHQLFTNCSRQLTSLIISLKDKKASTSNLQLFTNCSHLSKRLFIAQYINPGLEAGILAKTHPETPHHPKQQYYLTELGLQLYRLIEESNKEHRKEENSI